jgi:hypothetical protein
MSADYLTVFSSRQRGAGFGHHLRDKHGTWWLHDTEHLPDGTARWLRDVCLVSSQPLILARASHRFGLHAQESSGGHLLPRENPEEVSDYPTLGEFIQNRGFDPSNKKPLSNYPSLKATALTST